MSSAGQPHYDPRWTSQEQPHLGPWPSTAEQAIRSVLALHSTAGQQHATECPECGQPYPCPTRRILTRQAE